MKVLISGSSGFIGGHFLKLIRRKSDSFNVTVVGKENKIDVTNVNFIKVDLLKKEDIDKLFINNKFDYFIHFAWVTNPGESLDSPLNYDFYLHSVYAINRFYETGGKKFIGIGSCFEYDNSHAYCLEDTTPLKANNEYEFNKIQLFNYLSNYANYHNKEFIWARIFNVFGEGEYSQRLFPYIVKGLLNNKEIFCRQSYAIRDYLYVKDTVSAIFELAFSEASGVFNISSGQGIILKDFCQEINKNIYSSGKIVYLNEPSFSKEQVGNNEKLLKYYKPKYSTKDGILEAIKKEIIK